MIAEASDGLEPIMSIETISGEDLDHKMEVVLGEACGVMRKALREVTTSEERERIEGDLSALKDELRVGVRTIWEAAVAERDRLEKEAQAAMEKTMVDKGIHMGKIWLADAVGLVRHLSSPPMSPGGRLMSSPPSTPASSFARAYGEGQDGGKGGDGGDKDTGDEVDKRDTEAEEEEVRALIASFPPVSEMAARAHVDNVRCQVRLPA